MEVTKERDRGVLIAKVEGRIGGSTAARFEGVIGPAIEENDRAVSIDCADLHFIRSAGLLVVERIVMTLTGQNATIALCSPPEPFRDVVRVSGFGKIGARPSRAEVPAAFSS